MTPRIPVRTRGATAEAAEPGALPRAYEWLGAHLFYHGDLDRLLTTLIGPVLDELISDGLVRRFFFLRYWEGGSHLRLRLLPTSSRRRVDTMAFLRERADRFFATLPSPDDPNAAGYPKLADRLAAAEGRTEYADQLYPNNSLRFLPYVREHHRYGDARSMAAVEWHFSESSRLALRLLRGTVSPGARDTFGLLALLTAWFCCEPDVYRLRGHLDNHGYAGWQDTVDSSVLEKVDIDHERAYRRHAERLLALATRARTHATASTDELARTDPIACWTHSIDRLRGTLLETGGTARLAPVGGIVPSRPWATAPSTPTVQDRVTQVVDLCTHLLCNRLGISLRAEHQLRQLAIRAVIELSERPGNRVERRAVDGER